MNLLDHVGESVSSSLSELPLDAGSIELQELLVGELHKFLQLESSPSELTNSLELFFLGNGCGSLSGCSFSSFISHAKKQKKAILFKNFLYPDFEN